MMERDGDENEKRGQMDTQHWMVAKWFLMLSEGLAGVCGPRGEMRTFCRAESARTEE